MKLPVHFYKPLAGRVAHSHVVDVSVHGEQVPSAADVAQHIAHGIDLHAIETHRLHLLLDPTDDLLLLAAFAGQSNEIPEEAGNGWLVASSFCENQFIVDGHCRPQVCLVGNAPVFLLRGVPRLPTNTAFPYHKGQVRAMHWASIV